MKSKTLKAILISIGPALIIAHSAAAGTPLTLGEYLGEVSGNSPSIAAARLSAEGGVRRAGGAEVLAFPYLFGNIGSSDDKSQTAFPLQQGIENQGTLYTFGIGMNSPYGLNGKYSWNTTYGNSIGVPFPSAGNYTSYNRLDLTLNLVRNGLGSEISARENLIRAANTAQGLLGKFQTVGKLAEAEGAYWRLAFARQTVQVQRDVLGRSTKVLQWAKRRVGLQLGDRGDLLQAQATFDLHSLDLMSALEEEKNSARAFNMLRNQTGDSVPEAVGLPSIEETLRMQAPLREGERLDLQASAEHTKAVQAQAQLDKEILKPSVDITGTYAWNGRDPQQHEAISAGFKSTHPTKAIGVAFSVPLDIPTWASAIKGGNQAINAAAYELEQARLSESKDWHDLTTRLATARARLELTNTVEKVQREKFENEQQRLQRGRTTTFQAVTFEQDYAQAQLLRLRTQAEVLQLLAQMKSYRGNP